MDIAPLRIKPARKRTHPRLWILLAMLIVFGVLLALVLSDNQEAAGGLDRSVRFWL